MYIANGKAQDRNLIPDMSVVDLILMDHSFLKSCIEILISEKADKRKKLAAGKSFVDALLVHSEAEKVSVYHRLQENERFHFKILESLVEHDLIDKKIHGLKKELAGARGLRDEMKAELKVLAELVKKHVMDEEVNLLGQMREFLSQQTLREMALHFNEIRKFTLKDFAEIPMLQEELVEWKDSIQKLSSEFLTKMDKFVEDMHH